MDNREHSIERIEESKNLSLKDEDRSPTGDLSGDVFSYDHTATRYTPNEEFAEDATSSLPDDDGATENSPLPSVGAPSLEWAWTPAIPPHPDAHPAPPYLPVEDGAGTLSEEGAKVSRSLWETARPLIREAIETIVLTAIIFLLIRSVAQNFRIEGYSMEPNFHDGQYLITDKISYRLHETERGDVIVFEYPRAPQRDFIKRVVGLPGDRVEVRQGTVYIDGQRLDEPYDPNPGSYSWGPEVVPETEYFVLGDNRNNSSDSHTWGMLPKENIVGKAWAIYWPPSNWGLVQYSRPSFASAE